MSLPSTNMASFDPDSPEVVKMIRNLCSPLKLRLYFWKRLPTLLFWGIKVKSLSPQQCTITLPFGWRTQNPFRSIYFAAQCGAAELSTGLLASIALVGRERISMLITRVEAEFTKKANSLTSFTCEEGQEILDAVQRAIDTKKGQQITVTSVGVQENGEVVSRVCFTWSFKVKN